MRAFPYRLMILTTSVFVFGCTHGEKREGVEHRQGGVISERAPAETERDDQLFLDFVRADATTPAMNPLYCWKLSNVFVRIDQDEKNRPLGALVHLNFPRDIDVAFPVATRKPVYIKNGEDGSSVRYGIEYSTVPVVYIESVYDRLNMKMSTNNKGGNGGFTVIRGIDVGYSFTFCAQNLKDALEMNPRGKRLLNLK